MQPNQSMQSNAADVNSVQNKELLWTTLQESGAFAGLTREQFQPVQLAFDRSVQQASRSMSSLSSLSDVNKHIIRQFVQTELPMLRSTNQTAQNPKKKKIEMVYRAEDLQTERASEFDRQLREKQAEMDSFLTLKKPTDVSFTDAASAEDKPIGGEMSRLIAQELAARERELVQLRPEDIKKAQQWIGTTTDNNATNAIKPESPLPTNFAKKSVSFSEEEHEVEQFEPDEKTNAFGNYNEINGEDFEETDFIFSKFKKIQSQSQSQSQTTQTTQTTQSSVTMQQLYTKIVELEQSMNAKHAEIMACLNVSVAP